MLQRLKAKSTFLARDDFASPVGKQALHDSMLQAVQGTPAAVAAATSNRPKRDAAGVGYISAVVDRDLSGLFIPRSSPKSSVH